MLPIQPGDVSKTWANVDELIKDYNGDNRVLVVQV